jgi:hypothetical protein
MAGIAGCLAEQGVLNFGVWGMTFGEAERHSPNFSYRPPQAGSHICAEVEKVGWESQHSDFKNTVSGRYTLVEFSY